jgi:GDPmannose 4,6-dehydratase
LGKSALITGATGQDGSYLIELLLEQGYTVHAQSRHARSTLDTSDGLIWHAGDPTEHDFLKHLIRESRPAEIYNLAAITRPMLSWQTPEETAILNGLVPQRICQIILETNPECRLFQASTSEMFGGGQVQSEMTSFRPKSPYGISKAFAHQTVAAFRDHHGLHASCGILFNHESSRRPLGFVSQKIAHAAAAISLGVTETVELDERGAPIVRQGKVYLGNLHVRRDFAFAGDIVMAMFMIVQNERPDDYIVGSGESHSIAEFCETAFKYVGLNWEDHVAVDWALVRDVDNTRADPSKLTTKLGWKPTMSFEQLVQKMVSERIDFLRRSG